MAVKNPPIQLPDGVIPKFEKGDFKAIRHYRKSRLAGAYRIFGKFGFGEGVAGHITVRDPEHPECFWVNPFGLSFRQIKMSDLILVNEEGEIVEGKHKFLNKAAFAIHSRVHAARPDVVAAAHAHSIYGRTWSVFGKPLDPINQDACAFYDDHGIYDDYQGVVSDASEGDQIAAALGDKKAAILKNHGNLTVGSSVEECAWWFVSMERCCQAQILAHSTGLKIQNINHETALATRNYEVGFPIAGYFSFQPLWQDICKEQPDFMDEPTPVKNVVTV